MKEFTAKAVITSPFAEGGHHVPDFTMTEMEEEIENVLFNSIRLLRNHRDIGAIIGLRESFNNEKWKFTIGKYPLQLLPESNLLLFAGHGFPFNVNKLLERLRDDGVDEMNISVWTKMPFGVRVIMSGHPIRYKFVHITFTDYFPGEDKLLLREVMAQL